MRVYESERCEMLSFLLLSMNNTLFCLPSVSKNFPPSFHVVSCLYELTQYRQQLILSPLFPPALMVIVTLMIFHESVFLKREFVRNLTKRNHLLSLSLDRLV